MECLTWLAVDGIKRLLAQGDFTRPECVQRAVDEKEIALRSRTQESVLKEASV